MMPDWPKLASQARILDTPIVFSFHPFTPEFSE